LTRPRRPTPRLAVPPPPPPPRRRRLRRSPRLRLRSPRRRRRSPRRRREYSWLCVKAFATLTSFSKEEAKAE
jgi:hypothetical protein